MARQPWDVTREMFLSVTETDALLARVRDAAGKDAGDRALVDRVIVEGLLFSGLRCSEFCALRLADGPGGEAGAAFWVRGGGKEERTVRLPAAIATLVRTYARRVRPRLLAAGIAAEDPDGPLIVNERGRAYERSGLYRRVVAILASAGLESRASVQLLRHTYGYLAYLRTNGNLLFVQRQLGHSHPMITSVYAQFVDEDYGKLADRLIGSSTGNAPRRARPAAPRHTGHSRA